MSRLLSTETKSLSDIRYQNSPSVLENLKCFLVRD